MGSRDEIRDPIFNAVLSSPIKFREMLQNSLAQNRVMVRFLKERTMGSVIRTKEHFDPSDPLAEVNKKVSEVPFQCIEGDIIPFACNRRDSYCDIGCDHLLRLQNGPEKGPETRGHDCSVTCIVSRIKSLEDAEWGDNDIVEWATSCLSAHKRIYKKAHKYASGRETSAKCFRRTMKDFLKATFGTEKWTTCKAQIYNTSSADGAINAIKALELDLMASMILGFIPNAALPGSSGCNSTSDMWEHDGEPVQSVTGGVNWRFGREYHLLLNHTNELS